MCAPSTAIEQTCRLVPSGAYIILVRDLTGTNTGTYSIYAQNLTKRVGCTRVKLGHFAEGSITVAGNADCYTFGGTGGDYMRIRVVKTGGALVPNTEVVNPNGATLLRRQPRSTRPVGSPKPARRACTSAICPDPARATTPPTCNGSTCRTHASRSYSQAPRAARRSILPAPPTASPSTPSPSGSTGSR